MTIENDNAQHDDTRSGHSVGGLLREARESVGLSAADVARGLRIRLVYVQGIEEDNYAVLPGKAYVLGFLRSYAEFLGLDGDDVVARYRRQLDDVGMPATTLNFPVREPETRLPRGAILLLSLVLAAGAVYGGARYLDDETLQAVDRVAPVPDRLIAETKPAPATALATRGDPSSAFAAVTPQPSEAGAGSSVLTQPSPALAPATTPPAVAAPAPAPAAAPVERAPSQAATVPPGAGAVPSAAPDAATPAPVPAPAAAPAPSAGPTASPVRSGSIPPPPTKPSRTEAVASVEAQKVEPPKTEPAKPEIAKPTPQQQTQALNMAQSAAAPQTAALPKARDVVVVARVDSWIEVRDSNNSPLASLLLRVGDSYRVPEGANYRLVTGDVRGLEVRVDGVAVRQRGTDDNKPHRTLSLDGERLVNGNAVID